MNLEQVIAKSAGRVMSEDGHQVCLFRWAELAKCTRPELAWLYAVPNGGLRSKAVAGKLKAQGVKAGYPDIGLDVARKGFHGLRIELKVPEVKAVPGISKRKAPGKTSPEQDAWLEQLRAQGYRAEVAYGWENAMDIILDYLS